MFESAANSGEERTASGATTSAEATEVLAPPSSPSRVFLTLSSILSRPSRVSSGAYHQPSTSEVRVRVRPCSREGLGLKD